MVAANLVNAEGDAVLLGGVLQFRDRDRDAVDQEDHIGTVAEDRALLPPLVGHLEEVVFRMLEVDDLDVAFPVLLGDEDRLLSTQPRVGFLVAFDGRLQQIHAAEDVGRPAQVHDAGIQAHKLGFEDAGEVQACVAAPESRGHRSGVTYSQPISCAYFSIGF